MATHATQQRWRNGLLDVSDATRVDAIFQDLSRRYTEKHRAYHTLAHIDACLQHFDSISGRLEHPRSVELAIWFHDAIYRPSSKTNEEDSAHLATEQLGQLKLDAALIERVHRLVLVTKHPSTPENSDGAYLLDIDLATLGAPEAIFDMYGKNVRREYKWVPGFLYRRERAKVLAQFLDQDRIYRTADFHDQFEAQARANLERELRTLT